MKRACFVLLWTLIANTQTKATERGVRACKGLKRVPTTRRAQYACDRKRFQHYDGGINMSAAALYRKDNALTESLQKSMTGTDALTNEDVMRSSFSLQKWKAQWIITTHRDPPDLVKFLWSWQHPRADECRHKKLLAVRPLAVDLAVQLHFFAIMQLFAIQNGRVLIIDTDGHDFKNVLRPKKQGWHLGSWTDYFMPATSCPVSSALAYEPIGIDANSNARAVYWDPDESEHLRNWATYFLEWDRVDSPFWQGFETSPDNAFALTVTSLMVLREDLSSWIQSNDVFRRVSGDTVSMDLRVGDMLYNDCENVARERHQPNAFQLDVKYSACQPRPFLEYWKAWLAAFLNPHAPTAESLPAKLLIHSDDAAVMREALSYDWPLEILSFDDELRVVGGKNRTEAARRSNEFHAELESWQLIRTLAVVSRSGYLAGNMVSSVTRLAYELMRVAHPGANIAAFSFHGDYGLLAKDSEPNSTVFKVRFED